MNFDCHLSHPPRPCHHCDRMELFVISNLYFGHVYYNKIILIEFIIKDINKILKILLLLITIDIKNLVVSHSN